VTESLRARLYGHYVSGGQARAPASLAGLAPRAPFLRALVRRHFPESRDATVLDLGCGGGALVHFAREAGYRDVRGVDVSAEQVAAAGRLGIAGVEQGDLLEPLGALPEGSQDVIVAFDVMEHFSKEELLLLVDSVHRALRANGRWIIHVPNGESPFGTAIRYGDLTHELAFTRESISQLLLASGYRSVECFEDAPVAHGFKSFMRRALWSVARAGLRFYVAVETGDSAREAVFTRNLLAVALK
jgi:2-polyprenyl-3-methyl-5-hydroxy-6-metoxy-1,4-benzoquinol methylase